MNEKVAVVIVIGAVILGFSFSGNNADTTSSIDVGNSVMGRYTKAAVATNGHECAEIGTNILKRNGSAVDAAIAAMLCEDVACPQSMGLGGGFFMTIWDADTQTARILDARETAPALATRDMFGGNSSLSTYGGLAVAVPGALLGYWEAHKKYGRLPWAELFNATIELCKEGILVSTVLATFLKEKEDRIIAEPTMSEIFVNSDTGHVWVAGDRIKRPMFAATLTTIAEQGATVFYNGTMGKQLIEEIHEFGGIMQINDLRNYSVLWKTPTVAILGDYTMYSTPPPSSGAVLTFIMNVLKGLIPASDENTLWQRIVETFKWAYARRTELGDPNFVDISDVIADLTSSEYADTIRNMIRDDWTSSDPLYYRAENAMTREAGTAQISVLASDGSAVSVTSTINQLFGAMIRSKSTGIIFNDQMDDFGSPNITNSYGVNPSPANYIEPRKRPMSSTVPTIVVDENKKVRLIIGGAGGTRITTSVTIAMSLNLWLGYDIRDAIDALRLHHQTDPMILKYEKGFSENVLQYMASIGHTISDTYLSLGVGITAIAVQDGCITASSDYRTGGAVAGY